MAGGQQKQDQGRSLIDSATEEVSLEGVALDMRGDNQSLLLDVLSLRRQRSDVKEAIGTHECVLCATICVVYKGGG